MQWRKDNHSLQSSLRRMNTIHLNRKFQVKKIRLSNNLEKNVKFWELTSKA